MKSIARTINFKNLLFIITSLVLINSYNNRVYGEILKSNLDEIDFENALSQNSVKFHEYEAPKNLFDDFFGLDDPLVESSFKVNFQDLSLQIDSKNIRELYKEKLLEMTKKSEKDVDDELNWSFFNKKI